MSKRSTPSPADVAVKLPDSPPDPQQVARPPGRRAVRSLHGDAELDLVPIMNLVTILIPFLLVASSFVTLAVVDSTVPMTTDGGDDSEPEHRPMVRIGADGLSIHGAELAFATPPELPCDDVCEAPESYDLAQLTVLLTVVKDAYPDETGIVLAPTADVPYEVLIAVMDASRRDGPRELFPSPVIAAH